MKNIKIGDRFYDERHNRYLVTTGTGCDPRCWHCLVEEYNENTGEFELADDALFMAGELAKMKLV